MKYFLIFQNLVSGDLDYRILNLGGLVESDMVWLGPSLMRLLEGCRVISFGESVDGEIPRLFVELKAVKNKKGCKL
jgi:hypothetical protein